VETPVVLTAAPSIYPIHVSLHDQDGVAIDLDVHRGHPVIVSMFYGSCPTACPLLVSNIKELEASLSPEVRAQTRVLLVSFDREHDTPEALSVLASKHHVAADRWRLATGGDDDIRQIASALDVSYRKQPDGSYVHNSVIVVLDGEGRIAARTEDTLPDLAPLAAAVRASAQTR
jgi:protein SCO1/2